MALARSQLATASVALSTSLTSAAVAVNSGELIVVPVGASIFPNAFNCTGLTWNGSPLQLAVSCSGTGGAGQADYHDVSFWYLQPTASSTSAVVASFAGINDIASMLVLRYTGHNTASPIGDVDTLANNNGSGVAPSLTLTTASGDEALDMLQLEVNSNTITIGSTQSLLVSSSDANWGSRGSVESASGVSVVMSWGNSLDRGYCYAGIVVQAAAAPAGGAVLWGPPNTITLGGVL